MTATITSKEMAHRDPTIPMAHRVEPSSNESSSAPEPDHNRLLRSLGDLHHPTRNRKPMARRVGQGTMMARPATSGTK